MFMIVLGGFLMAILSASAPVDAGSIQIGASRKRANPKKPAGRSAKRRSQARARRRRVRSNRRRDTDKKKNQERYHVVQVNDTAQVVKKSQLETFKKKLIATYRRNLKAYKAEVEKAKKQGRTLTKKKPVLRFKVLTRSGYTTEKAANAYRAQVQKLLDKAKKKRQKAA